MVVEKLPELANGLLHGIVEEQDHMRLDLDRLAGGVRRLDLVPVERRQDHVDAVLLAFVDEIVEPVPPVRVRQAEAVTAQQVHTVASHPPGVPFGVFLFREHVRLAAQETHGGAVLEDELALRRVPQESVLAARRIEVVAGIEDALAVHVRRARIEDDPVAGVRIGEVARLAGLVPAPCRQVRIARSGPSLRPLSFATHSSLPSALSHAVATSRRPCYGLLCGSSRRARGRRPAGIS